MAEHHGFTKPHRTETSVIVIMQIAAANSAPDQTKPHFSRSRRFLGPFLDAYILGPMGNNRSHKYLPFDIAPERRDKIIRIPVTAACRAFARRAASLLARSVPKPGV
jgi:hypothetical protein